MPKKKPTTTNPGQHPKLKSIETVLVKDNNILKVETNVLRKHPESFEKKMVKYDKRNGDPAHFRDFIYQEFPSLSGVEFSLWRLSKDNPTLIPLPSNVNNATALCDYEKLNRSKIYIRLMVRYFRNIFILALKCHETLFCGNKTLKTVILPMNVIVQTAPTEVEEKSSSPSKSSELVTNRIITFENDDGNTGQSMVATTSTQPNPSYLHNVLVLPQFEMTLAEERSSSGELRLIPVTSNHVSTVAELNQPSSSFQTGAQHGEERVIDQSLQSNTFHRDSGIEAILSVKNDRKRKYIFLDSDDQSQRSKSYLTSMIHQDIPSDLSVNKEDEVAIFMSSMATREPCSGIDGNPVSNSGNVFPHQSLSRERVFFMQQNITSHLNTEQLSIADEARSIEVPKPELAGKFKCNKMGIVDFSVLKGKLYIIHINSDTLSIHSSCHSFEEIKTQNVEGMKWPCQISASSKINCLYILDGDESSPKCVWIITDSNEFSAKKLVEDAKCCSLSTTNEGDLVLLDDENHCLHLYKSENGRCFRCIHLQGIIGKKFGKLLYVICSQDNDYYISSTDDKTRRNIIYKISDEEELLNTFGGRGGRGLGQLSSNCHRFVLDKHGRLIVPDKRNKRVLLLNSNLEYMTTLISDFEIRIAICCDDTDRLFIDNRRNEIQFEPDRLMKIPNQGALRIDGGTSEVHMVGSISAKNKIRGVAVLFDKIYILTSKSILIHCGNNPYKRIHENDCGDADFWDIAADKCHGRRFFITDKKKNCIWLMGLDLRRTKWLQNIGSPYTLSVSKDGSVVIPNNKQQSIDIYKGKTAQIQLSIKLSLNSNNLRHALKLQDVYVVCHGSLREEFHDVDDECVISEVLLVSSSEDILRSFKSAGSTILHLPNHLAVDREGSILVADGENKRVLRLNDQLELEKILLSNDDQGLDEPQRLCYDEKCDQILICNSQSVDIFGFNLDIQMRENDEKSSPELTSSCSDQDDYMFELPTFQKPNQMNEKQMLQNKCCNGAALLLDRLYLIYNEVHSISVHHSDHPFHVIKVVDMTASMLEIVASRAHECCYIRSDYKICCLLYDSHTAKVFLEDEACILSMSVTAEGQLLVMRAGGVLASYNSDGECTECISLNDPIKDFIVSSYCVKTADGKVIYATTDGDEDCVAIFERSVDESIYISYGPFYRFSSRTFSGAIDLKDGQMLLLDKRNNEILIYDYKAHKLRTLLTEDDHQMSHIEGFCYSREKKQLLLCGSKAILFFQLSQNEQHGQSCEELKSLSCKKKISKEKDALEKRIDRTLCAVRVSDADVGDPVRGIARLENKTFILYSSKLRVINSKDIRTKGFDKDVHILKIPEEDLALEEGGLWDIAASHSDLCVYVTDKKNRCVWSVTLDHKIKKWLTDIDSPYTLSVNDDGCVCIPDNHYKQLDIYDSNGIRKNSIRLPRFMNYLCHAVQTPSGNYVFCGSKRNLDENDDSEDDDDDDSEDDDDDDDCNEDDGSEDDKDKGKIIKQLKVDISEDACLTFLSEISPEEDIIRTYITTQSTPPSLSLFNPRHLAVDADGRIFVADRRLCFSNVLLFDNQLQFIETLTDEFVDDFPKALCYDNHTKELLCLVIGDCELGCLVCFKV